jgi:hypothetical protein
MPDANWKDEVPVKATFTGLRGWPWIALATNSLNPVLRLGERHLGYRVLRSRERPYEDIEEVDVREAFGTFNLIFAFRGTRFTFTANVGTAARGAQVLARLPAGVPLSGRARAALQAAAR